MTETYVNDGNYKEFSNNLSKIVIKVPYQQFNLLEDNLDMIVASINSKRRPDLDKKMYLSEI